jgi:hypothetical protein
MFDPIRPLCRPARRQSVLDEDIRNRLHSDNTRLAAVSCRTGCLLYKNVRIKIHKPISLLIVLYGRETRNLILRKRHTGRLCMRK